MTNRKSHIALSIGAKINDLEWPWTADTHSVAEKMRLSEPITKKWIEVDPYYPRQKRRPMILVSGGIRFMRIFAEVPRGGGVKRQCSCRERQFSAFSLAIFSDTVEMKPALLYDDMQSVVGFSVICMHFLIAHHAWLMRPFDVKWQTPIIFAVREFHTKFELSMTFPTRTDRRSSLVSAAF